jgi:hypothetical protein
MCNNKVVKYAKDNTHTVPLLAYHTATNLRHSFNQTQDSIAIPSHLQNTRFDNCVRLEAHTY